MLKQLERSLREIKRIKFLPQKSVPRQNLEIYFSLKNLKTRRGKVEKPRQLLLPVEKSKKYFMSGTFCYRLNDKVFPGCNYLPSVSTSKRASGKKFKTPKDYDKVGSAEREFIDLLIEKI